MTCMQSPGGLMIERWNGESAEPATLGLAPTTPSEPLVDPDVEFPRERFGLRSGLLAAAIAPFVLALVIPLLWYSALLLDDGLFALLLVAAAWVATGWRMRKDGPVLLKNCLSAHHARPIDWLPLPFLFCCLAVLILGSTGYLFLYVCGTQAKYEGVVEFVALFLHTPIALGGCAMITLLTNVVVECGFDGDGRLRCELDLARGDLFPPCPNEDDSTYVGCRYFLALPILRAIPDPEIQVITRAIALEHFLYLHEHPFDAPPDTAFDVRTAMDRWARKLGFEQSQRLHDAWDIRNGLLHSQRSRPRPNGRTIQSAAAVLLRGVERAIDLLPESEQSMFCRKRSLHTWCQQTRKPQVAPLQKLIELAREVEGSGDGLRGRLSHALKRVAEWRQRRKKLLPAAREWMRLIARGWHLPSDAVICDHDCASCAQLPPGKKPLPVIRRIQEAELRLVLLGALVEYLVSAIRPAAEDTEFGTRLLEALGANRRVDIKHLMFALGARNDVVHPNTERELSLDGTERAVHYLYTTVLDLLPLVPPELRHAVTAERPEAWPALPDEVSRTLETLHAVARRAQQRRHQIRRMELVDRFMHARLDRLCGLDEIGLHLTSWFAERPAVCHIAVVEPSERDDDEPWSTPATP